MQPSHCRRLFRIALGLIVGSLIALGNPLVHAQESTPTAEPTEVPLAPTPTAMPEQPGIQPLGPPETSSPSASSDIVVSADPGPEVRPVVAYNAQSDTFLVVWQDRGDFAPTDIHARYLSGAGNPLGTVFTIALDRPGPVQVKVTSGSGLFMVAWREGDDPVFASLMAQRVAGSPSGTPLVGPALVVQAPIENQFHAVHNPDRGEFLFLWLDPRNSVLAPLLRGEVFGRRVNPDGTVDAQEFNFTPVPASPSFSQILNAPAYQTHLSVAYNSELGQYLLTYGIYNCTTISCTIREEVRGQRIDANSLARLGGTIFVTPGLVRIQWAARTLYDPREGRYVVLWNDNRAAERTTSPYSVSKSRPQAPWWGQTCQSSVIWGASSGLSLLTQTRIPLFRVSSSFGRTRRFPSTMRSEDLPFGKPCPRRGYGEPIR